MSKETLSPKQKAFVRFYIETANASEAYRRAYNAGNMGANAIHVAACKLLKHPKVTIMKQALDEKANLETLLTLEQHMSELKTLREMAKTNGQMSAAIKAEELRGKLRRFYVEQVEHGTAHEFDGMSIDELRAYVAEESKALGLSPEQIPTKSSRRPTNGGGNGTRH